MHLAAGVGLVLILSCGSAAGAQEVLAAPSRAQPQQTVEIRDDRDCEHCGILARRLVRLGEFDGPGAIERDPVLARRDSRGRYYVAGTYVTSVKVFDSQGNVITRVGRKGGGPGEFRGIGTLVLSSGDSLFIFDHTNVRYSVFDTAYRHVRTRRLEIPPMIEAVVYDGGEIVLATPVRTPTRVGYPLHLIGRDGNVRSFGSDDGTYRADVPRMDQRTIARTDSGRVWAAYPNQYVIELWDTTGVHHADH